MNYLLTAAFAITTLVLCSTTNAQQGYAVSPQTTPQVGAYQPPVQNPYYFGMDVQIVNEYGSAKLRVTNVTPGGPAQLAGLEYGDEIVSVNGQRITPANDSFQAVRNLNSMVSYSRPAPAPAAAASAGAYATAAVPSQPPARPTASMLVRNVRNGQFVNIAVYPRQIAPAGGGIGQPAPAAASPAAAGANFSYPRQ